MMVMKHEVSIFESLFALMEDTDNDEDKSLLLLDIKKTMKDYSLIKLRSLVSMLIDSQDDLAKDKESLKEALKKCEKEMADLTVQVVELTNKKEKLRENLAQYEEEILEISVLVVKHQVTCKTLSCENNLLNKRLDEITKWNSKEKGEGSRIHFSWKQN